MKGETRLKFTFTVIDWYIGKYSFEWVNYLIRKSDDFEEAIWIYFNEILPNAFYEIREVYEQEVGNADRFMIDSEQAKEHYELQMYTHTLKPLVERCGEF